MAQAIAPLEEDHRPISQSRGFDPLLVGALIATAILHVGVAGYVAYGKHGSSQDEKPIELNVMATQLVRKGVPRDKKMLVRQNVPPPPPPVKVEGPKITQDTQAAPAKPEKKKEPKKDNEEDLLKKVQANLRKQAKDDRVADNSPPEGLPTGSDQGTANTAQEGSPCTTAIVNGIKENWTVPEVVSEGQLRKLVARLRVRLNKNGSMTEPKIVTPSRNGFYDNSLLESVEKLNKSAGAKDAIARECTKFGLITFRFNAADLK